MKKFGIFGGSFDPPHLAHLQIAKAAKEQLQLDEVIFVPTYETPLKLSSPKASPENRLELLRQLIFGEPGLSISDIEVTRKGLSFTIETLREITFVQPGKYWLILGSDALTQFCLWKDYEKVLRIARIAVVPRPPHLECDLLSLAAAEVRAFIDIIQIQEMPVSSFEIRKGTVSKNFQERWLTAEMSQYITEKGFYQKEFTKE